MMKRNNFRSQRLWSILALQLNYVAERIVLVMPAFSKLIFLNSPQEWGCLVFGRLQ
jgi:hypothetical protein